MNSHDHPVARRGLVVSATASCDALPLPRLRRRLRAQRASGTARQVGEHTARCLMLQTRPRCLAHVGAFWCPRLFWPSVSWRLVGPRR